MHRNRLQLSVAKKSHPENCKHLRIISYLLNIRNIKKIKFLTFYNDLCISLNNNKPKGEIFAAYGKLLQFNIRIVIIIKMLDDMEP